MLRNRSGRPAVAVWQVVSGWEPAGVAVALARVSIMLEEAAGVAGVAWAPARREELTGLVGSVLDLAAR